MNNNDIFKKLRVALQLRDEQIIEILELVDFKMAKPELGALFRSEDHPNYMECGDQVLRNFLNGLVIHLRGTKDNPKNAMDVINQNSAAVKANLKANSANRIKTENSGAKDGYIKKAASGQKKSGPKPFKKNTEKKPEIVEKVRYKNGKK